MNVQPVILLTFSNSMDDYLPMIVAEQKAIKKALLDYVDKNYLQLRDVQHASTEEVFYLINRYHNRVVILHYGGHADGQSLQLEQNIGVVQSANAKGIAGLLGTQKQLKLVFLNGCASKGQVKALLDGGVQAVIATSVSIDDREAQQFAGQFYQALATGSTVREAFRKARAFIETGTGKKYDLKEIDQTRDFVIHEAEVSDRMPWGLYWKAKGQAVLDWKLPTESPLEINFASEKVGRSQPGAINTFLVDNTLKAIRDSEFVKELARKIHRERKAGDANRKPSDAEKKDAIVRSYLAPISVHLRALFSQQLSGKFDEDRLRQLLTTYEASVKLLAFIMLSDIWDATHKKREPLDLSDAVLLQLKAFFNQNVFTAPAFDYFQLGDALLKIAFRNSIQFYLGDLHQYSKGWSASKNLAGANEHFRFMKSVLEDDVPSRLIEPYCMASEEQLANVLSEWHFLIHYKMAVIKNIEVQQIHNMPPKKFRHILVELDNNYNDVGHRDRHQEMEESTDMESVLLYQEQLSENLNLSPFVLDENALTREFNSKIYFFSHQTETGLHYYWIENEQDKMDITDNYHGYVKRQFERARQDILNEKVATKTDSDASSEDDILSIL